MTDPRETLQQLDETIAALGPDDPWAGSMRRFRAAYATHSGLPRLWVVENPDRPVEPTAEA